jgi:hypothetical protein
MTPEEEGQFVVWWQQGMRVEEIARRLGIPQGTVSSRAAGLRKKGYDLEKRPNGGAFPRSRAAARGAPAVMAPAHTRPPPAESDDTPRGILAIDVLRRHIDQRFDRLEARLTETPAPPALNTRPTPAPGTRGKTIKWTARLSTALVDALQEAALDTGRPPSHLLEDWAWQGKTRAAGGTQ